MANRSASPLASSRPFDDAGRPRVRVLRACEPCRSRKKRCNGQQPCSACVRGQHRCAFSPEALSKVQSASTAAQPPQRSACASRTASTVTTSTSSHPGGHSAWPDSNRSRERISSTAFSRVLSKRLHFNRDANRDGGPASHLPVHDGEHVEDGSGAPPLLTSALMEDDMQRLAGSFFHNVHPIYSFLDQVRVYEAIAAAYANIGERRSHDGVLFGVAVLGCLSSGDGSEHRNEWSRLLALNAQAHLDADVSTCETPSSNQVAMTILRTLYLRCTARPYKTWLMSCTAVHAMGAAKMDVRSVERTPDPRPLCDSAQAALLVCLLNSWVSAEYGMPPATTGLSSAGKLPTSPREAISMPGGQILYLYSLSQRLHPEQEDKVEDLEGGNLELASWKGPTHDAVSLSRTILALTFYRQMRRSDSIELEQSTLDSLFQIGFDGLLAARRLAQALQPWWHVANVPFQFVCFLLVVDTPSSFSHLPAALQVFQEIAVAMSSASVTEGLLLARRTVALAHRGKADQVRHIEKSLQRNPHPGYPSARNGHHQPEVWQAKGQAVGLPSALPALDSCDMEHLSGLLDESGNIDWSFMLDMNIPLASFGTSSW